MPRRLIASIKTLIKEHPFAFFSLATGGALNLHYVNDGLFWRKKDEQATIALEQAAQIKKNNEEIIKAFAKDNIYPLIDQTHLDEAAKDPNFKMPPTKEELALYVSKSLFEDTEFKDDLIDAFNKLQKRLENKWDVENDSIKIQDLSNEKKLDIEKKSTQIQDLLNEKKPDIIAERLELLKKLKASNKDFRDKMYNVPETKMSPLVEDALKKWQKTKDDI